MADLVTRIMADDKQFNDKIEQSKRSVKGFSTEAEKAGQSAGGLGGKLGSLAGGAVTKLTGAFGLAVTAGAAFKKIIDSSQTSADGFQAALGGAKTTVDQFFKSISTGDFTNFVNGLGDVYNRAKLAEQALDQLWNTQLAFNLLGSEAQFKITSARADAMDAELSPEVRQKALADWKSAIEEMRGYAQTYRTDILETTKSIVQTYNTLGADSFGINDITDVFKLDLTDPKRRDDVKKAVFDDYKAYTEAVKQARKDASYTYEKATTVGGHTTYNKAKGFRQGQFDEDLKKLNEQYKQAILTQSLLEAATDAQLEDIAKRLGEYSNVGKEISTMDLTYNRMSARIEGQLKKAEKGGGTGAGKKVAEIIPEGSIAELEKKIQEAKKALANATTDDMRLAADNLIKELEAKKAVIEVQFKVTDPGNIGSGGIAPLQTATKLDALQGIDKLKGKREALQQQLSVTLDPASIIKLKSDLKGIDDAISALKENFNLDIKLPDTGGDKLTNISEKGYDAADGIFAVTSALHDMSYALDNSAGAWLGWAANALSAVGQAIPAIVALTATKKKENEVEGKGAVYKVANSVGGIPIVGPILALAAIASLVAAFAAVPKFAFGGIVPGGSFTGDRMLARVNSGEMILNSGQQSNLFRILNDGSAPGGAKKIELELSHKNLVAAIEVDKLWRNRR